jgi:cyclohexa-1,5-dienecarbonyl-CoA hydratase
LTGRSITAADAFAMGLACSIFPSRDTMMAEVDQWIQKHILPKSASSLRFAVRAARFSFNETLKDGLKKLEQIYLTELMATHDANEGIAAFLERRQPGWKNR